MSEVLRFSIIIRILLPTIAGTLLVHVFGVSSERPSKNDASHVTASSSMWVDGHYGYWWHYGVPPWRLPWSSMTHVVHFGGFYPSGTYPYYTIAKEWDVGVDGIRYQDSLIAIAHRNNVKVLMELGDNTGLGYDSIAAQGDTVIQSWVHNVATYMLSKGYDGADVDLEPQPGPIQQAGWGRILHYLRDTLSTWNPRGIITVDVMSSYSINWNPDTLAATADHINLMEYDQGGKWSSSTTFNSPLYAPLYPGYNGGDDSSGVMSWIANNGSIPASKFGLGVPLYGRMFFGAAYPNATPNNNYQNRFYNDVVNKDKTSPTGTVYWQDTAKVPYISDPGQNQFVTYDDTLSLRLKAEFAARHGLGGIMMFGVGEGYLFDPPLGRDPNELSNTLGAAAGRTISPSVGDTVRPMITLISPANGDTVIGFVTLAAQASDDVGIARVDFLLNGYVVAKAIRTPYTVLWNAGGALGSQRIAARAFDIAGNYTAAPTITVIGVPPPPPPLAPALASPIDSAIVQPTNLAIMWNSSNTATSYRLQVSTDSLFSTSIHDDSTITGTSRQLGPLAGTTTYYWHVNAKNKGGTSAFSPSRNFATTVPPPAQPTLLSPINGAANQPTTLTLSWNSAAGATSYRVQLAGDSLFSTIILDDSAVTATSRQAGPLANNTKYYWHVGAINTGGKSAYSTAWNFKTVVALPAAPVLLSPASGATCQSTPLTMSWNPSSGATTYRLQLAFDSLFNTVVFDATIASTSKQVSSLIGATTYYWRVNALNAGGSSPPSNTRAFTTFPFGGLRDAFDLPDRALPGTNKWVLIQNQPNGGSMVIASNAIRPFSNAGPNNFGGVVWDSLVTGGAEASLTLVQKSASYYYTSLFIYGRMNNKDYNTGTGYRLRYLEQSGQDIIEIHRVGPGYANSSVLAQTLFEVNPGDVITFRVLCDNQTMAALVNNVQILSVRDTIYRPQQWYFAIRGSIFPTPVIFDNFRVSSGPGSPVPPPPAPVLISPANGALDQWTAPILTWSSSIGATSYRLQAATDSLFGSIIFDDSTFTTTSTQRLSLSDSQKYYWRVRASNDAGVSTFSTPWNFTTMANGNATVHHLEYAVLEGWIFVYDIDGGHALVRTFPVPDPGGIRGAAVSPNDGMLYISYGGDGGPNGNGSLLQYNLIRDSVGWIMHYNHGIDSHAITPDGTTIFMPAGEFSSDGKWYVINTSDGSEKGFIVTSGYGPHNTVVSLDGAHVYLGDRNHNNVGPDSLYVASTASYQVVKRAGRFMSGIRPFTVNGTETFAFVAITGLLGFQVCDLSTGLVPYKIDLTTMGFSNCGSCDSPTHGISLSPDERELYVCDQPNSYVHVFDVSGIFQNSAPTKVADIKLVNLLTGNDSGCTYECLREGWLHHSRDGRFVYVGESGDVISTATRSVVARLPALRNSRKMLEIDWQNGRPIATTTRYGLGYVVNRSIPLPPPPVLSTPSNGAAGQQTTVNLTWNASAAASSYRLQLSTDSAFSTLVVDDSTLTAMSRQVTSLSGTTTYYWHVNAKNNAGTSAFSSTWSFTTSIPPPAAPALLSPVNNATGQATTVTFLWNSSSGATKYRYQLTT
ncbi:MAG TPA: glycosyl hydrolase family 18 protein, partial [Bacteroidota bacterium]|nr:glycosyl hydrolase family 18 protein [Bacteroidota bacterium]